MYTPGLLEKVGAGQQGDRLREAELARLFRGGQTKRLTNFKLTVFLSGAVLIMSMIVQLI